MPAGVTLMPHSPYFGPGFPRDATSAGRWVRCTGGPGGMIERYHVWIWKRASTATW